MDLTELAKMGASLIEGNSDSATTGLDLTKVAGALQALVANKEGGIDLGALLGGLSSEGNVGEILNSWLGNGENQAIAPEQVSELVGEDKVADFAKELGLNMESAKGALSDVLPQIVDQATRGDNSIVEEMMGGSGNTMEMLSKMFR